MPTREKIKNIAHIEPQYSSNTPTPDEHSTGVASERTFKVAAASLRRTLAEMPELTEASRHMVIDETTHGLNLELVDQDGESMFPEGSKEPYELMRRIVDALAKPLKVAPFRISIVGHTEVAERVAAQRWKMATLD